MEELDPEEQFLRDARNGNLHGIQRLLMSKIKEEAKFDINCKGKSKSNFGWTPLHLACYFGHRDVVEELLKAGADANLTNNVGDTPLHKAAFTGRKEVVMLLLQYDACPSVINGTAQIPKDVTRNEEVRSMLEGEHEDFSHLECIKGMMWRKIRFAVFHLSRMKSISQGVFGVPRVDLEMTKLGRKPGKEKKRKWFSEIPHFILFRPVSAYFIKYFKQCLQFCPLYLFQSTRFFGWHFYWVVLQDGVLSWYSKQCFDDSVHHFKVSPKSDPEKWLDAIEEHSAFSTHYCSQELASEEDEDELMSPGELNDSLQRAQTCHGKFEIEVLAFLSMVKEDGLAERLPAAMLQKLTEVSEASRETCSALRECLDLFSKRQGVCSLKLEQEVEKNKILSEALQTLATEHHELEQSVVRGSSPRSAVVSEDDFYDAVSDSDSERSYSGLEVSCSLEDGEESRSELYCSVRSDEEEEDEGTRVNGVKKHRTSLPAPMFSRNDFSIWSILRKSIGMLSESSSACVAAFAVSAVASQWERTGKPFNPLLGETYELVREDLGFRLISEQVSHHPPVSAFHTEGLQKDFVFHGSIYPKLKFWGKSVEAEPKGTMTLELPKYNEAYTWTNPTCCVHNIIVGQLWIEQYGNVEVINHRTGERCCLNFKPCGLFGKELHKVEGYILDKSKKKVCVLYGKWTECMYTVDPATFEAHKKNDKRAAEEKKTSKQGSSAEAEETPQSGGDTLEVIPGSQLLWKITPRPANSAQMYNFTTFAMQLNELDEEMEAVIPKTDCRLRPDIRAMENGDIDLASQEKKRLEEKQRAARKNRSKSDEDWKTRYYFIASLRHTLNIISVSLPYDSVTLKLLSAKCT
uniref:Oxysterol-binding protein n=1 Tax=Pygocentrus nattereri TaxID=42514 RepID=A0AAR2LJY2_PYGNA